MKKLIGYFDFLCPYCYLGTNYARRMQSEIPCEIEWHPINIHPEMPPGGEAMEKALSHVKDPVARIQKLRALAEKIDLPVVDSRWVPNTQKALEAMEFARDHHKEHIFMPSVFNAYFGAGLDIGKEEVLISLIEAVGLNGEELKKAWQEKKYEGRMNQYIEEATKIQLDVVPTLVKDGVKVLEATTTMDFAEYQDKFKKIW